MVCTVPDRPRGVWTAQLVGSSGEPADVLVYGGTPYDIAAVITVYTSDL